MQPFFTDLLARFRDLHRDMASAIEGLPQEALDWVPAQDMNSLAVLVVHTTGAECYWIGAVAGQRPSDRDREAEFHTQGLDAAALQQRLAAADECAQEVLAGLALEDLAALRTSPRDGQPYTVGWALSHALEHTGVHLGHVEIMRQLWDKYVAVPGLLPTIDPGVAPDAVVSLREVSKENLFPVLFLSSALTPPQKHMVATNALSIAEAHYSGHAWYRAIYAGETPVGFLMLHDTLEDEPGYFLWRLMVAYPYQKMGFARRAIELLIEYVKTRPGAQVLGTSCGQGLGSPEGFYLKLGFKRDGKMYDDEVGLSLPL